MITCGLGGYSQSVSRALAEIAAAANRIMATALGISQRAWRPYSLAWISRNSSSVVGMVLAFRCSGQLSSLQRGRQGAPVWEKPGVTLDVNAGEKRCDQRQQKPTLPGKAGQHVQQQQHRNILFNKAKTPRIPKKRGVWLVALLRCRHFGGKQRAIRDTPGNFCFDGIGKGSLLPLGSELV